MASKIFSLYRYQIIPTQNQLSLLYDINELIERKNIYFEEALLSLKMSEDANERKKYQYDIIRHGNNKFIIVISRQKKVSYYKKDYTKDTVPSFPPVYVIVDNDKDVQIVAIESSREYSSVGALLKNLGKNIQRTLAKNNLLVKFSPIYKESSFWKYIENNKDRISSLHFSLITPNMSSISGKLCDDFIKIAKETRAAVSNYQICADGESTLNIEKSNDSIAGLADYTSKGGGDISVRLKGSKMHYKSNDYQLHIEFDELELTGDIAKLIEQIRSKVDGADR